MALERIHLRKLLKIMFLDAAKRRSEIRTDIRADIAKEDGIESSGGDFYGPFWADAKNHVFGISDLHEAVAQRVDTNPGRANLYPQLRDGFLHWWNERRRWTNEPVAPGAAVRAHKLFPEIDAVVKVENILSVRDGLGFERVIYPYFSPDPVLSEQAARLGMLAAALPDIPAEEIRILDVIRGRTFSIDRTPLQGNEEADFLQRYRHILMERNLLRAEYA